MREIKLDPSWKKALEKEFTKPYWEQLATEVRKEYSSKTVYPPASHIFRAFDMFPFDKVKVVIVGQDTYHGPRQANGLSFSVSDGITLPPSLKNIYKELHDDLGVTPLPSAELPGWPTQAVFLLISFLL